MLQSRKTTCALVIFLSLLPSLGAAITLDDVMAVRFPSGVEWSPDSRQVAFIWDVAGRRNLYLAPADGSSPPRQLTQFAEDGPELSEPRWSPTGAQIAFAREGQLYVTVVASGETKSVAGSEKVAASDPRWSPEGSRLAYVSEGVLYTLAASGGSPERVYRDRIGRDSSPRWSPDGQWLAFVSTRGRHSFVGLYNFARKDVRWLDPSTDEDRSPAWSPDSKQVAFIRLFSSGQTAQIHVAPAQFSAEYTVVSRVVWEETNNRGVDFYLEARFAAPDRLLVRSEADGFAHLYRVDVASGERAQLTRGNYEDEFFDVAKSGTDAVVASNTHDLHERGLRAIDLTNGNSRQLTGTLTAHPTAKGTVDVQPKISPDGSKIAYLHSSPLETEGVWIMDLASGKKSPVAEGMPPGLKEASLAMPEVIDFASFDGQKVYGILYRPAGATAGTRTPAIVFIHGGPIRQMVKGWHYLQYYHDIQSFHQYLVEKGYAVLCLNYRGGIGYGRDFRQAVSLNMGRVDYEDSVFGARWLSQQPWVAAGRIAIWGGSYGGYMTGLALGRAPELFRCGVALHGVFDWRPFATRYQADEDAYWDRLFGGTPEKNPDSYYVADAVEFVKNIRAPLLMFHGDNDHNVPYDQSREFIRELRKYQKEFQFVAFPDEPHDFLRSATWRAVFQHTADFFDRYLKE